MPASQCRRCRRRQERKSKPAARWQSIQQYGSLLAQAVGVVAALTRAFNDFGPS